MLSFVDGLFTRMRFYFYLMYIRLRTIVAEVLALLCPLCQYE